MKGVQPAGSFARDTVLVTGASGFIGAHLCRRLLADGAAVHGVYRTSRPDDLGDVRWRRVELSDAAAVHDLVSDVKPDVVFHLAGFVSGDRSLDAVLPALRSNLIGTVNLLAALTEVGCRRAVLAGSQEEPDLQSGEVVPSSPYAAAKFAAHGYAAMFHALYDVPVVNARIFMAYGPGQRDLRKLVPYLTLSLLRRERPTISNGARRLDWIYVDDVVEGLLAASDAPDAIGGTFDLGSGTFTSVRDVALLLRKIIDPTARLQYGELPNRRMESERLADTAESRAELGWSTSVPIEEGLARTATWYAERLTTTAFAREERGRAAQSVKSAGATPRSTLPALWAGVDMCARLLGQFS